VAYHEAIEKVLHACGWLVINKTKLFCLEKPIKKHVSLFRKMYICVGNGVTNVEYLPYKILLRQQHLGTS
jgi:hypothetical protein